MRILPEDGTPLASGGLIAGNVLDLVVDGQAAFLGALSGVGDDPEDPSEEA